MIISTLLLLITVAVVCHRYSNQKVNNALNNLEGQLSDEITKLKRQMTIEIDNERQEGLEKIKVELNNYRKKAINQIDLWTKEESDRLSKKLEDEYLVQIETIKKDLK